MVLVWLCGGGSLGPAALGLMFSRLNRFTLTTSFNLCPSAFSKLIIVGGIGGFPWAPEVSQTAPLPQG